MKRQFLFLALGLALSASAQEEMFKVLTLKGQALSQNGEQKDPLLAGRKLYKEDKVELSAGSYVGLMHRSGRTLELKTPGVYAVSDLSGRFGGSTSIGSRYANYVFGEINGQKDQNLKKNHQQYMAVTGAVTRALPKADNRGLSPRPLLPAATDIIQGPTPFSWLRVPAAKSYVVVVSNMFDEVVFKKEVADTSIVIDFSKLNLKNQKMCLWSISSRSANNEEASSTKYGLKFMPTDQATKVQKEAASFKEANSESAALEQVLQGAYYEEHHLYLNALNSYKLATTNEPEVAEYAHIYRQFLVRMGLEVVR